jgi:hypothetical protein
MMQNTFLFKAMKETHKQCKTKIDIDELKRGTTNITHYCFGRGEALLQWRSPYRLVDE